VTVNYDGGSVQLEINQRHNGGQWVLIGAFNFPSGSTGSVTISNANTDGVVVADAVQFVKVSDTAMASYHIAPNAIAMPPVDAAEVGTDLSLLQ
ncbi:MAG TPA: hypothetical protein VHZ30_07805, partial [Verrucomicrobiae bacterium]|nr:hypothetical protein [Verrucomicrobiae bacterium]